MNRLDVSTESGRCATFVFTLLAFMVSDFVMNLFNVSTEILRCATFVFTPIAFVVFDLVMNLFDVCAEIGRRATFEFALLTLVSRATAVAGLVVLTISLLAEVLGQALGAAP